MSNIRMIIQSSEPIATLTAKLNSESASEKANGIEFFKRYISDLQSGLYPNTVIYVMATETPASGTATCASVIAGNTITIGSKVLTASASPANQDQFLVGSNNATAASLAACINANSALKTWLSATAALNVVIVTCIVPGVKGNHIPFMSSATISLSGSFLANGADGVFNRKVI
jgi:hypothetical protein